MERKVWPQNFKAGQQKRVFGCVMQDKPLSFYFNIKGSSGCVCHTAPLWFMVENTRFHLTIAPQQWDPRSSIAAAAITASNDREPADPLSGGEAPTDHQCFLSSLTRGGSESFNTSNAFKRNKDNFMTACQDGFSAPYNLLKRF